MPYHKEHDAALEAVLANTTRGGKDVSIGTTKRGIGPAYADKVHRATAIRVGDLIEPDRLLTKLRLICTIRTAELAALGVKAPPLDPDELADRYAGYGRRLQGNIQDTVYVLHDCLADGRRILFEGANACLLDIDHRTFPYVTSSNCSALGIPAGTGVPGKYVDRVVGTMKAYTSRVGEGPFPTEQDNDIGDLIRERGHEYGTTTNRPRRCGWLDLVAVKYSSMICGVTGLACMLLDVLSGFDELKLCTGYRLPDGSMTDRFLPDAERLAGAEAIYETMPGWDGSTFGARRWLDLPAEAIKYVKRVEELIETPVALLSTSPERDDTILVTDPFRD